MFEALAVALGGALGSLGRWQLVKLFLAVGLCGGLSTFSTFSNETLTFIQAGNWAAAGVNIAANVITCLVAVCIGLKVSAVVS